MQCKVEGCSNEVVYKTKGLCKKCYQKAWAKDNKQHIKDKHKEYRKVNKEHLKDYNREYNKNNKERKKYYNKTKYKIDKKIKPLYWTWVSMKQRCSNFDNKDYKNYGGRGIKVCDRWLNSYENFALDMGERPEGMTLDRIDVNGNYSPSNCKWSTITEQNNNKRGRNS